MASALKRLEHEAVGEEDQSESWVREGNARSFSCAVLDLTTTIPQPPIQALTFPTLTPYSFPLPQPKSTHYLTTQQSEEEFTYPVSPPNAYSPLFNFTMFYFFLAAVVKPTEGKTVLRITHWRLSIIKFHPYINTGVNTSS